MLTRLIHKKQGTACKPVFLENNSKEHLYHKTNYNLVAMGVFTNLVLLLLL